MVRSWQNDGNMDNEMVIMVMGDGGGVVVDYGGMMIKRWLY